MKNLVKTEFDKTYEELSNLNESHGFICSTDDPVVLLVTKCCIKHPELKPYWDIVYNYQFKYLENMGFHSLKEDGPPEQTVWEMLEQIHDKDDVYHSNLISDLNTSINLDSSIDIFDIRIRNLACYVVNKLLFLVLSEKWLIKMDGTDVEGFKADLTNKGNSYYPRWGSTTLKFKADTWSYQGTNDYTLTLDLKSPTYEDIATTLPINFIKQVEFQINYTIAINNTKSYEQHNLDSTYYKYYAEGAHDSYKATFYTLAVETRKIVKAVTDDMLKNRPTFYIINFNPDIINQGRFKGCKNTQEAKEIIGWYYGPQEKFELRLDRRQRISNEAVKELVWKPLLDIVNKNQWTVDNLGNHVINFDIDIQELKKYTKDNNLPY